MEAGVPELSNCLAADATHQQQPLTLPAKVSTTGGGLTPGSPAGGTPPRSVLGDSPLSCEELLVAVREVSMVRRTQGVEMARAHPESLVLSPGGPGPHKHLHSQKLFEAQSILSHEPILQMSIKSEPRMAK